MIREYRRGLSNLEWPELKSLQVVQGIRSVGKTTEKQVHLIYDILLVYQREWIPGWMYTKRENRCLARG